MGTYTNKTLQNVAITDTAGFVALNGKGKQVIVSSSVDAFIAFEVETVTGENGFYIGKGVPYVFNIANMAKIAYIRSTADGRITFAELF